MPLTWVTHGGSCKAPAPPGRPSASGELMRSSIIALAFVLGGACGRDALVDVPQGAGGAQGDGSVPQTFPTNPTGGSQGAGAAGGGRGRWSSTATSTPSPSPPAPSRGPGGSPWPAPAAARRRW